MRSLEVVDLHKSYSSQAVLKGLDLVVPAGTFTSILGPSGSGKTTLLRVIAGFERADRGCVRLAGELVDDGKQFVPADRRKIGYVPQEGSLFPHLSVRQNVGFGLARRERRGARVEELLSMVGLAGLSARYPHQLSGGQQQRVAVARALVVEPAVLLADEFTAELDADWRGHVLNLVLGVARRGGVVVIATHDHAVAGVCTNLLRLTDGRVAPP
jgi:iron(III) transport system ATP-binding protein